MKKVLVSGYIGFNNFGDEAIFYALSNHLRKMGLKISVLCNNKSIISKKYDVEAYNYKKPFEILKAILKTDVLISGGGSLLQNKTSNFSLFYYLSIIILAKLLNKKVIIFAQGIEPIVGKFPELITKMVLKTVDFISLRDKKSLKLLNSWQIESTLVSDPAYSLVENIEIIREKEGLIVQLRSFYGMTQEFVSNLAYAIANNYQGKISVFSFQDEIDEKICVDFITEMKKFGISVEYISNKTIDETIEILNKAKYVISTRLHGLIIATALKSRVFAVCYDEKIKTLVNELDLQNVDILSYSKDELNKKIDKFFSSRNYEFPKYRKFEWENIDKEILKK